MRVYELGIFEVPALNGRGRAAVHTLYRDFFAQGDPSIAEECERSRIPLARLRGLLKLPSYDYRGRTAHTTYYISIDHFMCYTTLASDLRSPIVCMSKIPEQQHIWSIHAVHRWRQYLVDAGRVMYTS